MTLPKLTEEATCNLPPRKKVCYVFVFVNFFFVAVSGTFFCSLGLHVFLMNMLLLVLFVFLELVDREQLWLARKV